ncbi:MAG: MarR family transcriptional regulator [Lachnospiraceae bacterium]
MSLKAVLYNQLTKELDDLYQHYIQKSGLSEAAFWVIYCIQEREAPYTQAEFCEIWSYRRQTVNSALKNLVKNELIELVLPPNNRKSKQIFLTEKGKVFVKELICPLSEAEKNTFVAFGDERGDEFLQLTRKYIDLFRLELNKRGNFL